MCFGDFGGPTRNHLSQADKLFITDLLDDLSNFEGSNVMGKAG